MMSSSSPTTRPDIRIVLLGKTGVGKSASGNSIVGDSVFLSEQSSSSVTTVCQKHSSTVAGMTLSLVDTPSFFMTESEDVSADIKKSVALAYPGVHAFLYIVAVTTFTKQEASIVDLFKQYLGDKALRYTVVLFTYGDQLDGKSVESVMDQNASLTTLIEACGWRYCVFNNKLPPGSSEANDQVTRLLQMVDGLMRSNGGSCYTVEMLEEAQRSAEEIREETRREEERPHQEDIQRAVQEANEPLRKEKERQEKENRDMQLEKESLQRQIREEKEKREKESKQTELTANKVILPPEPDPETPVKEKREKERRDRLKFKLKYILGFFITVAMGGCQVAFLVEPQHAERYKVFAHGWAMGAASMINGASAVEVWMVVRKMMPRKRMLNRTSHRDRWVGVMCGFAAGALTGHLMGTYELPRFEVGDRYRLLTGAVGAYGAYIFYRS